MEQLKKTIEEKNSMILGQQNEIWKREQNFFNMHEKATDYCMNQEKELMGIKDQYLKLEKEHSFVMVGAAPSPCPAALLLSASLLHCFIASLVCCFIASLLHCFIALLLCGFIALLFHCFVAPLFYCPAEP